MIKNFIKIAFRNLIKHKIYTLINVFGLAIGFTAFILVGLYVDFEYSWDKHNANYERIYRVQRHMVNATHAMDGNNISPHTFGITAKILYPKYPEIESVLIIKELEGLFLSSNNLYSFYDEKKGISAEQSIFQIFTYIFKEGDQSKALIEPNTIVLSESLAKKLFPEGEALGNMVVIEKKFYLKVTGVYYDLAQNSSVRPDYIVSLPTIEQMEDVRNSYNGSYMTYVLLKPNQDVNALNHKIWNLFQDYNYLKDDKIKLCPLSKVYLSFNDQKAYTILLSLFKLIGIFILILAAFNYVNLTTANTSIRAKEIGLRKVHGSSRKLLFIQFLGETMLLSVIALGTAFLITEIFLATFNNIVDKELVFSYTENKLFLFKIVLVALLTGALAGIYPSAFMATQKVVLLFKGNIFKSKQNHFSLKKILIILQFSISIFLIVISTIVTLQMKYLMNKDLGLDKENMLYATINVTSSNVSYEMLRNRILKHPEILNCSMSQHAPFVSFGGGATNWEGCQPGEIIFFRNNAVSYDYLENYKIELIEGRNFDKDHSSDINTSCLINETAKKYFGYENTIGKRLDNGRLIIVGVMKDFHYKDMYNTIEPVIYRLASDQISKNKWTFSFRINGNYPKAEKIIQTELETFFPNDPFEVRFLTQTFLGENVFMILRSMSSSLMFFTVLNILLASIGLLGLVSFATQQRTKEIGIRKINGSSTVKIFFFLIKEYMILLVIAAIISFPICYWAYLQMPANYKIDFPYWVCILASVAIMVISIIISLYHTLKATFTNPVEALRYE